MPKTRIEAFSDGVIAIIITIMVLEMKVPHGSEWSALTPLLPVFLSYALSFIYVGIYWNNHHHMLHAVKTIAGPAMWANLHLLFWLTMIPITTTWTGKSDFSAIPTALYAFVLFMCAIAYWILERVIIATEGKDSSLAGTIGKDLKGRLSLAVYALTVGVSFFSTTAATLILIGMAAFWFCPDSRIEKYLLVR